MIHRKDREERKEKPRRLWGVLAARGTGRPGNCALCAPFRFELCAWLGMEFWTWHSPFPPKRSLDGAPLSSGVRPVRAEKKRFTTPIFFVDKLLILWGGLSLKGRGFRGVFVGKWLIPLGRLRF